MGQTFIFWDVWIFVIISIFFWSKTLKANQNNGFGSPGPSKNERAYRFHAYKWSNHHISLICWTQKLQLILPPAARNHVFICLPTLLYTDFYADFHGYIFIYDLYTIYIHLGGFSPHFSSIYMSDAQNSPYRKFIKSGNEERLQDGSRPGALRASFSKITTFCGHIFHLIMP